MNRWRVGEDRGSKETDRCPLTPYLLHTPSHDTRHTPAHSILIPLHTRPYHRDPCIVMFWPSVYRSFGISKIN
jgi:hypothetical protein